RPRCRGVAPAAEHTAGARPSWSMRWSRASWVCDLTAAPRQPWKFVQSWAGACWEAGCKTAGPMARASTPDAATLPPADALRRTRLMRTLRCALAVAVLTMALKVVAWLLTGSVGLLSDAAESLVNVVAAGVALLAVTVATRPPDE